MNKKLDNMTAEEMYWFPRKRFLSYLPFLLVTFGFVLFDILRNGFELSLPSFLLALLYFVLLFQIHKKNRETEIAVSQILYKNLDIHKYTEYITYGISRQKPTAPTWKINSAIAKFFRGEFSEAVSIFESVLFKESNRTTPKKALLEGKYFHILSLIHSGMSIEKIQERIKQLESSDFGKLNTTKSRLVKNCLEIQQIMNVGQVVETFENTFGQDELLQMMYQFYLAKNEMLKGDSWNANKINERTLPRKSRPFLRPRV